MSYMNKTEFSFLCLPKWPAMFVYGKPVSEELAIEIILRTDSFMYSGSGGNNKEFNEAAVKVLGIPDPYEFMEEELDLKVSIINKAIENKEDVTELNKKRSTLHRLQLIAKLEHEIYLDKLGYLKDLSYINNNWMSSAFVFGPHGWIHPDGKIGYVDNIGKNPDPYEIYEEWELVAKEFPELDLKVSVLNCESGEINEVNSRVAFTLEVKSGQVNILNENPTIDWLANNVTAGRVNNLNIWQSLSHECYWNISEIENKILPIMNKVMSRRLKYLTER